MVNQDKTKRLMKPGLTNSLLSTFNKTEMDLKLKQQIMKNRENQRLLKSKDTI